MTALAADRNTKFRSKGSRIPALVAASTTIYAGGMVALNSAGYAVPAANTAGLRVIGIAAQQVDNSAGAAGDKEVDVDRGIFKMALGTQPPVQATVGLPVFAQDDATVGKGGAATSAGVFAGLLHELDEGDGLAWVDMTPAVLMAGVDAGVEAVSAAGAISVLTRTTTLDVTGTTAYTLANGIYEGQRKTVTVIAGASTPAGTITPTTPAGHATVSALGAVGDTVTYEWHFATGWLVVSANGVTVA